MYTVCMFTYVCVNICMCVYNRNGRPCIISRRIWQFLARLKKKSPSCCYIWAYVTHKMYAYAHIFQICTLGLTQAYIYIYIFVQVCVHAYINTNTHTSTNMYTCIHKYKNTHIHTNTHIYVNTRVSGMHSWADAGSFSSRYIHVPANSRSSWSNSRCVRGPDL
jgi:hypothetical protein